jgi:hypothetical protein
LSDHQLCQGALYFCRPDAGNESQTMGEAFPGQLGYIFLVSIIDAAILSWLTLRWYRGSVRRLMLGRSSTASSRADELTVLPAPALPASGGAIEPVPDAIRFALFEPGSADLPRTEVPGARPPLRKVVLAYCAGAGVYAAVMTGLMLGPDPETLPLPAWIGQWWINAWPVMPTLAALLVLDRGGSLRLVAQYVAAGSAVLVVSTVGVQLARGSFNSAVVTNVFWMLAGVLLIAWLPFVLLLVTGWRRVRAVMPLALATTLLFGFALMVSTEAFIRAFDVAAFRDALLQLAVVTSAESARYAPFMLMSLPIGWLAWPRTTSARPTISPAGSAAWISAAIPTCVTASTRCIAATTPGGPRSRRCSTPATSS